MATREKPPMVKSDEATEEQLQMGRKQGEALEKALRHMIEQEADDGAEQRAGDYLVGYAVEKAEGMYGLDENEVEFGNVKITTGQKK